MKFKISSVVSSPLVIIVISIIGPILSWQLNQLLGTTISGLSLMMAMHYMIKKGIPESDARMLTLLKGFVMLLILGLLRRYGNDFLREVFFIIFSLSYSISALLGIIITKLYKRRYTEVISC